MMVILYDCFDLHSHFQCNYENHLKQYLFFNTQCTAWSTECTIVKNRRSPGKLANLKRRMMILWLIDTNDFSIFALTLKLTDAFEIKWEILLLSYRVCCPTRVWHLSFSCCFISKMSDILFSTMIDWFYKQIYIQQRNLFESIEKKNENLKLSNKDNILHRKIKFNYRINKKYKRYFIDSYRVKIPV